MKQILLLVAVYSLIFNQISKGSAKDRAANPKPKQEVRNSEKEVNPATFVKNVPGKSSPRDFVAPVFSFTTLRLMTSYPIGAFMPAR